MLLKLLIIFASCSSFFIFAYANHPKCSSCKWYIPHKSTNNDYGLCGFYKNSYILDGEKNTIYEFASHCRKNESMCGERGLMYEPSEKTKELKNKYEELENRCCGEVNETDEIEQLERDMFELMQKIKKHNKRNIYKTTKDLYKLFKQEPH